MPPADAIIVLLVFAVATLYSSVGHGGASGYLAVFALLGAPVGGAIPVALALNVLVAGTACIRFAREGAFRWRLLVPFVLTSIPAAWAASGLTVSPDLVHALLALALLSSAVRLAVLRRASVRSIERPSTVRLAVTGLPAGAGFGLLAGLTGIGGGVFLSPLLIFLRWTDARGAAAVASAFIICNSAAGLLGAPERLQSLHGGALPFFLAAAAGAVIGARLGAVALPLRMVERALAGVLLIAAGKLLLLLAGAA